MRHIAIIGGGQSALQLALALQQERYAVTLVSERTPDEIENGPVMSSQCMFGRSLSIERDLRLNFWDGDTPEIEGLRVSVAGPDGTRALDWAARLERPAQSVDQRLKHAAWMRTFESRGGRLLIRPTGIEDLEDLDRAHDLVVVAGGKGELSRLFERDGERSPYDAPQRALALTYVHGMAPADPFTAVSANFVPGVGEYFVVPALTTTGICDIMVFEGIPGGPMDCWSDVMTPAQHLARSREVLARWLPWEAARCESVALTDANGVLTGRLSPAVRKPVAWLPSGEPVLGMGDAVVLNDPITGQGANNACKNADVYLTCILAHGDRPFDAEWMADTFERYWEYAQWSTGWTNAMLPPPPPHVLQLLGAAQSEPGVASAIVNGFDHPPSLFPWIADPAAAERFIAEGGRPATAATVSSWP